MFMFWPTYSPDMFRRLQPKPNRQKQLQRSCTTITYLHMGFHLKFTMIVDVNSVIRYLKKLHQLCGIKLSKTIPYHPSGNGQTKRMNRTIISMLKTLNKNQKASWKDYLSKLVFTYNSTINKSTGYSPFFLMFGRSSRLPIDSMFTVDIGEKKKQKTCYQFVSDWKNQMNEAIPIA